MTILLMSTKQWILYQEDEKELDKNATVSKNEIVQFDKRIKKLQQ